MTPFGEAFTEIRLAIELAIDTIALRAKLAPSTIKACLVEPRRTFKPQRFVSLLNGMGLPHDGEDANRLRALWNAMPNYDAKERTPIQAKRDARLADALRERFDEEAKVSARANDLLEAVEDFVRTGDHRRAIIAATSRQDPEGHPYNWILDEDFPRSNPDQLEDWNAEREVLELPTFPRLAEDSEFGE